jgi:hypothetical protein
MRVRLTACNGRYLRTSCRLNPGSGAAAEPAERSTARYAQRSGKGVTSVSRSGSGIELSIDRGREQTVQGRFRETVLGKPLTEADLVVHQAVLQITQCAAGSPKGLEVEVTVQAPHEGLGFPRGIAPEDGSWGFNCWRAQLAHPESRALVDISR